MATKKPAGIPLEELFKNGRVDRTVREPKSGSGVVTSVKSGFKRNYDIEFKTALDEALHRNAVVGVEHRAKQTAKARKPRGRRNLAGPDGRKVHQVIEDLARKHDVGSTPTDLWPLLWEDIRVWVDGDCREITLDQELAYEYEIARGDETITETLRFSRFRDMLRDYRLGGRQR